MVTFANAGIAGSSWAISKDSQRETMQHLHLYHYHESFRNIEPAWLAHNLSWVESGHYAPYVALAWTQTLPAVVQTAMAWHHTQCGLRPQHLALSLGVIPWLQGLKTHSHGLVRP